MFSPTDTIVAIATPPGRGGLGVVRLSGPEASPIALKLIGRATPLEPRLATFANLRFGGGPHFQQVGGDQVVLTYFVAPASYTGEDVIEISAHGSPVVLHGILRAAMDAGARLAEPGEFTLRAFLNGKLDLIQAEAVRDLIDAVTPLQARTAFDQLEGTLTKQIGDIDQALLDLIAKLEASLDFPDEGYHFVEAEAASASTADVIGRIDTLLSQAARGRLIRDGAQVAIVGAPNVGKSSLFNTLVNANRAIVTPIPGTTRDLLTERADIGGLPLSLIDTAGVRDTSDAVEREGVSRARQTIDVADLTLLILDRSRALTDDDRDLIAATRASRRIIVLNKSDLPIGVDMASVPDGALEVSATTGEGVDRLVIAIGELLSEGEALRDQPSVTNVRHIALLEAARESLCRAQTALASMVSEEFPLLDLQEASAALQEITGKRTADDLLNHIFSRFCIGK